MSDCISVVGDDNKAKNAPSDYATKCEIQKISVFFVNGNYLTGTKTGFDDIEKCNRASWNKTNSGTNEGLATSFVANAQGAFDMAGNVAKWCWDWHGDIVQETVKEPKGAVS